MRLSRTFPFAAGLAAASLAQAQEVHFNELFPSHTGTDTMEYIELIGTPGMSLDNIMVLTVDGDTTAAGTMDHAWDLTGSVIPADGYFVMGNIAVPNMDFDLANGPHSGGGTANNIENGTNTYYLIEASDPAVVQALMGDIDTDDDLITFLSTTPADITILDLIAMVDDNFPAGNDFIFDGATDIGPDGPFLPAGIFRPGDYPACWCTDEFLPFDTVGITPGTANPSSACTQSTSCGTGPGPIGTNYCGPASLNSAGFSGVISGVGSLDVGDNDVTLTGSDLPMNQFAMFVTSQSTGFVTPPNSSGNLCLSGNIGRYKTQIQNSGAGGSVSISVDLTNTPVNPPVAVQSGETWHWQLWYRDIGGTSNFTDGLTVTFN